MNPLSIWTYHRRHKRQALLLLSLSTVVTVGLYALVALVWGVFVEPGRLAYKGLSSFSLVTTQPTQNGPDPEVLARLQSNPDIAKIIPSKFIRVELPGLLPGQGFPFDLLGLTGEAMNFLQTRLDARLKEGRLPQPGAAEMVLSEEVAKILNVSVGESYIATSYEFYKGMEAPPEPTPFEVVGILDSEIELGMVSLEFLNQQEEFRKFPPRLLVVAQEGRQAAVDDFLRREILSLETGVMTPQMLSERLQNEALPGLMMLLPVVLIVAIAFAQVIVVANQIANTQRLPEFGILHATGRSKNWLGGRLTIETTTLTTTGWVLGILIAGVLLYLLKWSVFADLGHDLNYPTWLAVGFSVPIPVTMAGFTFLTVRRTFTRLDPVAIVERRELSQETGDQRPRTAATLNSQQAARLSSPKPLGPATFYQRHRRRAVVQVSAMGLMIIAIVLFIFTLAVGAQAKEPFLGYLSRISIVRSAGIVESLDPGVVTQVEAQAAVARVIPVAPRYNILDVYIPPFNNIDASPLGVYAEDMAYLVEHYDLALKAGQLPHPGTNEMVIPEALAQNRDLEVGDVIGDPDHPAYPNAPRVESEFVISGIFAGHSVPEDGNGLGFISLEFLESQAAFDLPPVLPLIVVPKAGQKGQLDDWLENELAGENASVLTYRQELARLHNQTRLDILSMALLEGLIASVAALGLAVLSDIFIAQRQAEFGVLNALGYGRRQLVWRVVGETIYTTGAGWGLSVIAGLIGMLCLRFALFAPRGLTFDLLNLTPWLYTLPIPMAVLAVTSLTTAWRLSKLDPVAIIERRLG